MRALSGAELYKDYFGFDEPHIFVGARRFKNREFFADDLVSGLGGMPESVATKAKQVVAASSKPHNRIHDQLVRSQFDLAIAIVERVGVASSSILIFVRLFRAHSRTSLCCQVSGMREIIELTERISRLSSSPSTSRRQYLTLPIHSDIPDVEQGRVFTHLEGQNAVCRQSGLSLSFSGLTTSWE